MNHRPHTTAILAMTADGKIADFKHSAARFGSINDKIHREKQRATDKKTYKVMERRCLTTEFSI